MIESFHLPAHWAAPLINGDESGLDDADAVALDLFVQWMITEYGQCWCFACDGESDFMRWHDAARFGVLACDVYRFAFDVTPRGVSYVQARL